jgi:hypothetical protein
MGGMILRNNAVKSPLYPPLSKGDKEKDVQNKRTPLMNLATDPHGHFGRATCSAKTSHIKEQTFLSGLLGK